MEYSKSMYVRGREPFILKDKTKIYNVHDLLDEITIMKKADFEDFALRNDFSNWIGFSVGDIDLAKKLKDVSNKLEIKSIIIDHYKKEEPKRTITQTKQEVKETPKVEEKIVESQEEPKEEENLEVEEPKEQETPSSNQSSVYAKSHQSTITKEDVLRVKKIFLDMKREINKVFIGQDDVVEKVSLGLICNAHVLLEGVPGLAKTLLIETLSKVVKGTSFKRIQFLPDLLPSDILGGQMFNPASGEFKTVKGPIFANFVLADEINRAPPKTHAALMEAMQEKKVSIDKVDYPLDKPFFVLATQNPLENKGTYELPEAVVDRFMFKVILDYPERKDELIILTENATTKKEVMTDLEVVVTKDDILQMQDMVRHVYISQEIREYIMDIVEATRGKNKKIEGYRYIKYGGGPRASIYLTIAGKAQALIRGRDYVLPEDIRDIAPYVLRHRLILNFVGKAHNISPEKVIEEILLKTTPI